MRLPRLAALFLALALAGGALAGEPEKKPHSVVLFIGDGMGLAHVTLGRLAAQHAGHPYVFDRFKTIGLCATRSADSIVTDSAAASTALSSGYKTNNGFLGLDPLKHPRTTILELAHAAGLRTGLVTTTTITNATPAGFASHVAERNNEDAVAAQYLTEGVDVLMGGGQKYFPAARVALLSGQGYSYVGSAEALRALPTRDGARLLGVFTPGHMSYEIDRDPAREPSLREMTVKALDLLGKGGHSFFCMVEGGKIDHAGHLHDAMSLVHEQLAFADAVGAALEHVERGDDLLVLVTADHTTGGLALSEKLDLDGLAKVKISGEALVAKYPGVKLTESFPIFKKVCEENYFFTPTEDELATARRGHGEWGHVTAVEHAVSLHFGVGFFDLDHQQLLQNGTHGHEGSLVPVFAAGPGAERFTGIFDNTTIPKELARLLGLPSPGALVGERKRFY